MATANPEALFTLASVGTLAGASAAVVAVTNTARKLFKLDSAWPAFLASCIVAFVGAYGLSQLSVFVDYVIAFLNACLLFCMSTGLQETIVTAVEPPRAKEIETHGRRDVKWLSHWMS